MTPQFEKGEHDDTDLRAEARIGDYESPTVTPLGTTQEAMADIGGVSGLTP